MSIVPVWQDPDEPAHFAYVQYMEYHRIPPRQDVIPAGQHPWLFGPSSGESLTIDLSQRAQTLLRPRAQIHLTPSQREQDLNNIAHFSERRGSQRPGRQNYVAIYPPLYYKCTALILRMFDIRNTLIAVYLARFISALWFGLAGVIWNAILRFVISVRRLRWSALVCFALSVPTFGMLGGAVSNDIIVDMMSLTIFWASLWSLQNREKLFALRYAVGLGLLAGVAIWTKEEAYLALLASTPVVFAVIFTRVASAWARWAWIAIALGTAFMVSLPWLGLTMHRYGSIIPPLTYQGSGGNPRTLGFVLGHQAFNLRFELDLMVTQLLFGIDCPWWQPWMSHPWIHWSLGIASVFVLVAGLWTARMQPGRGLTIAWIVGGWAMLWALQWQYDVMTGTYFLQGRYFLFLIGPWSWLAAHVWLKISRWGRFAWLFTSVVLSLMTMSHTLWRYYHETLVAFILGHLVMLAPTVFIALSRLGLGILCIVLVTSGIGMVKSIDPVKSLRDVRDRIARRGS